MKPLYQILLHVFSYDTFNNRFHRKTINTMWLWSAMNDPPVNKDRISSSIQNLTGFTDDLPWKRVTLCAQVLRLEVAYPNVGSWVSLQAD